MKNIKSIRLLTLLFVIILISNFTSCSLPKYYVTYSPKLPSGDLSTVKTQMSKLFNDNLRSSVIVNNLGSKISFSAKEIIVLDDKIEFIRKEQKVVLDFQELIDRPISVYGFAITIDKHLVLTLSRSTNDANTVADNLYFIKRQLFKKRLATSLAAFAPIAAEYAALKVKPPVSEEQRKFIVQANSLREQKKYSEAISLYVEAIKLDNTAYPAGYYNIALLDAQLGFFDNAIYEMKKYLLLMPDAADARSAQDKIYEWELMASK